MSAGHAEGPNTEYSNPGVAAAWHQAHSAPRWLAKGRRLDGSVAANAGLEWVGWVEAPSGAVTHRRQVMGSASLHPSYERVAQPLNLNPS